MKNNYENIFRNYLPRRTHVIIRLDGKAFHTFTKGLDKPWDADMIFLMDGVTEYLCKNIQGAKFGYTQSDEISILLTDFDTIETQGWFDYNIQKMVSVSASMATLAFNEGMRNMNKTKFLNKNGTSKIALFDSRVMVIPLVDEVINYFVWRQDDAIRNSVQMLSQNLYSQKELSRKNKEDQKKMCADKGHVWESLPNGLKWGRAFYLDNTTGRGIWMYDKDCPVFKENRNYINNLIPSI